MVLKSTISFLLITFLLLPLTGLAQSNISIGHIAYTSENLPEPGTPLELSVILQNTRATSFILKTHIEIDGKYLTVPGVKAALDENDRPSYKVRVYAPLAGMTYMFTAESSDGSILYSRNYSVQRSCIPPIKAIESNFEQSTQAQENIETRIARVKKLESELKQYERALILANNLKHIIYEGANK